MIAPLGRSNPKAVGRRRRMHGAHRLVVSTLLEQGSKPIENAPPVAAWRAWTFAGWVVIVTGVYLATMLGWL
ncbi:MAG: hypothetical protein ABIK89_03875 [Planctomycetota bacterium]